MVAFSLAKTLGEPEGIVYEIVVALFTVGITGVQPTKEGDASIA